MISPLHNKCGLRKVILGGYGLHLRIFEPGLERAHRGGVASEQAACERVDLKDRDPHDAPSLTRLKRRVNAGRAGAHPVTIPYAGAALVLGIREELRWRRALSQLLFHWRQAWPTTRKTSVRSKGFINKS